MQNDIINIYIHHFGFDVNCNRVVSAFFTDS